MWWLPPLSALIGLVLATAATLGRTDAWVVLRTRDVPPAESCALSEPDTRWIQRALDGWERASSIFLALDPLPLPWMVLFDDACTWHLAPDDALPGDAMSVPAGLTFAGQPVPVFGQPHDGNVWLPTRSTIPVQGVAFASLYRGEDAPYFVLALPSVWRADVGASAESHLDARILGVFSHEIVHTRQLVAVTALLEQIRRRYRLPENLHDDIVEDRFAEVPGYRDAYEAETVLLYQAASESDAERKRALVAEALALIRGRQAGYFTGAQAFYRELEELFLNMEGVGQWAAYTLSRIDPAFDIGITDPAADRSGNTWSQDQGLALFLLIDELVPRWQRRVLGLELASPYELLEEAIGRRP